MLPPSHTCLSPSPCIYVDFSSLLETRPLDRAHTHYRLILSWYLSHTHYLCLCHTCTPSSSTLPLSHTHMGFLQQLARCPCIARNIKMHLYELFILWGKRMNEGRPYLQMWRGVWVSFCKIAIVSFLSVRYRSDGLYCRMAGTRSSPTMLFIRVGIKNRVGDDGGPAILQCRSSNLYLTDRKENMAIYPHSSPHLQIRPSLVHPFLPQDLDVPCNARASC